MKIFLLVACVALLASCTSGGSNRGEQSIIEPPTYRLTTSFTGAINPLGVEQNSANALTPILIDISQTDSTLWTIEQQNGGLFEIASTASKTDNVLTVLVEGNNKQLALTQSDASLGQRWSIVTLDNGSCRIDSQLVGPGSSLDIINDDEDRKLKMAVSGNFTGQFWQIESVAGNSTDPILNQCSGVRQNTPPVNQATSGKFVPTSAYRQTTMHGFSVFINPMVDTLGQTGTDALALLDSQLEAVSSYWSGDVLTQIQQVRIWMEGELFTGSSGQFHPSAEWLTNNGYNPDKAGAIEISSARNFLQDTRVLNVSVVLHELAHARQFYLTNNNSTLNFEGVYNQALISGSYDNVEYVTGSFKPAYAMTDSFEYFAELSEAYFGMNDFFPFNQAELLTFDPDGYELIRAAWAQNP